jgi:two-component system, NarL family, sensor histidine kinase UhpB
MRLALPGRLMLRSLWHGRSIRAQLLLVFVAIDLIAVLLAGTITIWRARTQTQIEMAASVRLAELLVGDAAAFVHQQVTAEQFLRALPKQLRSMRHVRIEVRDATGAVLSPPSPRPGMAEGHPPAPAWFKALVAPTVAARDVPVTVDNRTVGQVEIIGEPDDEIAEVWDNLIAIGSVAAVLNLGMIGILYVLFGRVLDPLTVFATGLSDLEHKSYSIRLTQPRPRELATIAAQFNALASALETARSENLQLNRRLITAQDDERRRTALELHDEVGPCLFGLRLYASSIASAAAELPHKLAGEISERASEIVTTVEHLQAINRTMLDRLRPMALGHVPLKEMLGQLTRDRARQSPQISFGFTAEDLARSYGDSVDLTVYRCVQESLTNAVRHAEPKHIDVRLRHNGATALLELMIKDDGRGMAKALAPKGLGIRGMQERVEGLGGRYRIESEPGRGTCVHIAIPLGDPEKTNEPGAGEMIGSSA